MQNIKHFKQGEINYVALNTKRRTGKTPSADEDYTV